MHQNLSQKSKFPWGTCLQLGVCTLGLPLAGYYRVGLSSACVSTLNNSILCARYRGLLLKLKYITDTAPNYDAV